MSRSNNIEQDSVVVSSSGHDVSIINTKGEIFSMSEVSWQTMIIETDKLDKFVQDLDQQSLKQTPIGSIMRKTSFSMLLFPISLPCFLQVFVGDPSGNWLKGGLFFLVASVISLFIENSYEKQEKLDLRSAVNTMKSNLTSLKSQIDIVQKSKKANEQIQETT